MALLARIVSFAFKIESTEQSYTQTIQHVMLCQCSGRESQNDSWEEVVECETTDRKSVV